MQLGLRYEFVGNKGISKTTNITTENSDGQFFPLAYISFKLNSSNQFSLNYSKRIDRSNFRALNPFFWYSNPNSYSTGNPELQATYNHNFELNYIYKGKFSANYYYEKSIDNDAQISFLDGINMVSSTFNYYNRNNYGLDLNYSDTFFKFWESNVSTSFSYSNSKSTNFNATPQNGNSFYYSSTNTFQLNKDKTVFLFLNYWQSIPSKSGNGISKRSSSLSTGMKLSFLDNAL